MPDHLPQYATAKPYNLRLPPELYATLHAKAEREQRTMHAILLKIIAKALQPRIHRKVHKVQENPRATT